MQTTKKREKYEDKMKIIKFNNERFFEKIMFGQSFLEAPIISSRICGSNSVANNIVAVRAIEIACGIVPSVQTEKLRELMLYAQIIQSHTLHLYSKILPYFIGVNSLSELQKDHQEIFKNAITLKNFADNILTIIGGRSIHPISNVIGGFASFPSSKNFKQILDSEKDVLDSAQNTLSMFANFEYPDIKFPISASAIHNLSDYPVSGVGIWTTEDKHFLLEKYKEHILEEIQPNSDTKYGTIDGKQTMVGPLARFIINQQKNQDIKKLINNFDIKIDIENPFHNILAEAIEINLMVMKTIELITGLLKRNIIIEPIKQPRKYGASVAGCEGPGGTIIHHYELDSKGKVIKCDIVTPTVFNQPIFESIIKLLKPTMKEANSEETEKTKQLLYESLNLCQACGTH